jgi:hypothetical protein
VPRPYICADAGVAIAIAAAMALAVRIAVRGVIIRSSLTFL